MIKLFVLAIIIFYLMHRIETTGNDNLAWVVIIFLAIYTIIFFIEVIKELNLC